MDEDLEARLAAVAASTDIGELLEPGCVLYDLGFDTDAEACFRRASGLESPEGAFNLANTLVLQGRLSDAVPVFELALERGETGAWVNLGLTLYDLGDIPGAMHAYAQAETAGDSGGPLNLAMLLHDHGDTDAALSAARRAADAGHPAAPAVVASWQWNTTLDPGLEQALRAGADHFPPARADLGDLLRTIGRVDEAVQVLRDGMGRGEVESMIPLANLYWDVLDDCDAAREVLTIAADHGDSHAHHNLAVLLEEHDELEVSALHYRLAIAGGDTLAIDALRDLLGD